MLVEVFCLDTGERMWFSTRTPYEAMQGLIYCLNLRKKDKGAHVEMYGGGRTLSVTHHNKTWSCLNQ